MLNGVGWSEPLTKSLAAGVALVAGLLVYRDASTHGTYHALSATAAVTITGLVGYAVGDVVGLFVAIGYVLLLYLLSYPTTPTADPTTNPRGDAGENIASEHQADVVSVIRVEIASDDTLRELARRYDDIPNDGTEAELRSALRVKALASVRNEVDGENTTDPRSNEREITNPDAPAARASEYGIEEWSNESRQRVAETVGEYGVSEWADEQEAVTARAAEASTAASTAAETEATTAGAGIWETDGETTERPNNESEMVFGNTVEREPEPTDTSAEATGDGDPFDGRGELYDGDATESEAESSY